MSTDLRKAMGPINADRLLMAVSTDDLIQAVNIPLRARHGQFAIDFTGVRPVMFLHAQGCEPEQVAFVDTRKRCAVWWRPKQEQLALMLEDITRRLAAHGAALAFITQRDKQQRVTAKLQIVSHDSRHIALWLAKVPRKTRQGAIGPFEFSDEVSA
ncbi:hypothetical protein FHR47_002287 [Xanthomonas arboricola]|uniref:hypothetical protein n=1 Tax=Xanthomonas cannabis TaxID=1885674 RepID=UPI00161C360F|nr:hypothetical protein [Xanthomonas cannabis]MBB3802039.1 hypothetical protein [Xanthomonas cannabis]